MGFVYLSVINKTKSMANYNMTRIGRFDADNLHRAIDAALKIVADNYGLQFIKTKTFKYDSDGMFFSVPVEGRVKTLGENGLTSTTAANSSTARRLENQGLMINELAYFEGVTYRITGYNPRNPKNSIELVNVASGKPAKCSTRMAKTGVLSYKTCFPERVNQG